MTDTQVYMLKRLARGVSGHEIRKWDQRPLRGLYMQRLFRLDGADNGTVTELGWERIHKMGQPAFRKDPTRPLFKRAESRRQHRRTG